VIKVNGKKPSVCQMTQCQQAFHTYWNILNLAIVKVSYQMQYKSLSQTLKEITN